MHAIGRYRHYNKRRRAFTWPYFAVSETTRSRHLHVIGKSGVGKSTFLLNSIMQDIRARRGCIVIDPKGDLAIDVLRRVPPHLRRDVIYFEPFDIEHPLGFNPIEHVEPRLRSRVASRVLAAFHHLFKDSWGPQLEQILKNALLAVLCHPQGSLLDVKFLLTSKEHRARILAHVDNPMLREFWETDFAEHMPEKEQRERTLSTLNKIGQFLTDPMLLNIVAQRSSFDFREIIDDRKIFIANLDQGQMGEGPSELLGSFLISAIHSAALSRTERSFFPVYVDEFHLFGSSTFAHMLSILRSFGVGLTLANQYLAQLDDGLRSALLGTVGTTIAFQIGVHDQGELSPLFRLTREDDSLTDTRPFAAYVRTPGETIHLFMPDCDAKTYPSGPDRIRKQARAATLPRDRVELRIRRFVEAIG